VRDLVKQRYKFVVIDMARHIGRCRRQASYKLNKQVGHGILSVRRDLAGILWRLSWGKNWPRFGLIMTWLDISQVDLVDLTAATLTSIIVHNNVSELWLFIREFPIAPMLNPSLKTRFM